MIGAPLGYAGGVVALWCRLAARIRGLATLGGLAMLVGGLLAGLFVPGRVAVVPIVGGMVLWVVGVALGFVPAAPRIAARPVGSPVAGRWIAINSLTSRVPSHGTHAHGQPSPSTWPTSRTRAAARSSVAVRVFGHRRTSPGFGQPVYAPADGRIVAVRDTARDHRSRSTWPAFGYLMLEGMIRELAGSPHLMGNVVVLDIGDGTYAALAHLKRGSVMVRPGQRVRCGDPIARCGNSGNSSEPHLHFQLMDHPNALLAAGLPFTFCDVADGLPATGQPLTAPQPTEP